MDLDLLKKKRYNLHTVSREKNKHIFLSNSNSSSPSSTSPINTPIVTFHRDKCPANCTTKTRKQRLRASERSRSGHRDRWEKKKRKTGRKEGEREEKRKRKPIVVAIKREENAEKRKRERRISIGGGGRATAAFRGRRNRRDGAGEGGGEERVEARLPWLYPHSGRGVKITNELSRWALSRVRPRGYGNRLCSPTTPFYESASLPPPPLLRSRVRGPAWILPIYVVEERTVLT